MKRSEISHSCRGLLFLVVLIACSRTSAISHSGKDDKPERKPQSRIVFSKGNLGTPGIRVVKPDGTDFKQLTNEKFVSSPKWSPDGALIAFLGMREADYETLEKYQLCMHSALYIMDGEGSGQRRITDVPVVTFSWSPDSQNIAFISGYESSENSGKDGIVSSAAYVVDLHGKKLQRLTEVDGKLSIDLCWSPSGKQIAYSSQVAKRKYDIFTVDANGSNSQRIAAGTNPIWSPDGKRILFLIHDEEIPTKTTEIHVVDIESGKQQQVSVKAGYVRLVGFSPDGKKVLHTSYENSTYSLCIMDSDGSNTMNLSRETFKAIDMPQFVEDGNRVCFTGRKDKEWKFYSVNVDGSAFRQLADNPREDLPQIINDATE